MTAEDWKKKKEEKKAQRKQHIKEVLAAKPQREKKDLVATAPLECQAWLYANPLDISLKTLRQYVPGLSTIFWLKHGGGYASFETEGACSPSFHVWRPMFRGMRIVLVSTYYHRG